MESFKNLHSNYVHHKAVIERLTGSIAADQLLLRLLQGLKQHVEKMGTPDSRYQEFEARINFTVNHEELERAKLRAAIENRRMNAKDPFEEEFYRKHGTPFDDEERPPYT